MPAVQTVSQHRATQSANLIDFDSEPPKTTLSRTQSLSYAPHNLRTQGRSYTTAAENANRKRLSLSFPVAVTPRGQATSTNSPLSSPPHSGGYSPDPRDSGSFLTALAAQERRVLELRVELTKAETELNKLKRQWALHEATKTREEVANLEARRLGIANGDEQAKAEEMALREQMAQRKIAAQRAVNRRSFPGSRHHRTLSLLSPQKISTPPFPTSEPTTTRNSGTSSPTHDGLQRASMESVLEERPRSRPLSMIDMNSLLPYPARDNQEAIIRTGKQLAEGFKDGMLAFWEDLRQATVGEEATSDDVSSTSSHHHVRRACSKSSLRSAAGRSRTREGNLLQSSDGDLYESGWVQTNGKAKGDAENSARWSNGTALSEMASSYASGSSRSSTPRTSYSSVHSASSSQSSVEHNINGNQQAIWGTMPFNIKKTATTFLTQVEKSLIPPASDNYHHNTAPQPRRRKSTKTRSESPAKVKAI